MLKFLIVATAEDGNCRVEMTVDKATNQLRSVDVYNGGVSDYLIIARLLDGSIRRQIISTKDTVLVSQQITPEVAAALGLGVSPQGELLGIQWSVTKLDSV